MRFGSIFFGNWKYQRIISSCHIQNFPISTPGMVFLSRRLCRNKTLLSNIQNYSWMGPTGLKRGEKEKKTKVKESFCCNKQEEKIFRNSIFFKWQVLFLAIPFVFIQPALWLVNILFELTLLRCHFLPALKLLLLKCFFRSDFVIMIYI